MSVSISPTTQRSIRRHLALGAGLTSLLFGGVGGWAATTSLSGAVIAHGSLIVGTSVSQVQHPFGGVVAEILVREGDRVEAGQPLARLDPTQARTNLQIVDKRLDELRARTARGEAEQAALHDIALPPELASRLDSPGVGDAIAGEQVMFDVRRLAREGQKSQLSERINEYNETIAGLVDQIASKERQIELLDEELKGVETLLKKKLVTATRVTALQRERAEVQGDRGQLVAAVAEARGKIAATKLEVLQIDHDMREQVSRELGEARAQISEFVERKTAAEDELARTDIRAPLAGVIHKLSLHTVGGVVRPGETIMEIVPQEQNLVLEVKLSPRDINDVHIGQATTLRFSGVNQRTTPEIDGTVSLVSADVTEDQRTGQYYYSARIGVTKDEMARLEGLRPMPGMPVEAFIKTRERTALSYMVQPLSDQIVRAFREK